MFFLLVDARSKWPEVVPMQSTTATKTVECLRTIFARHVFVPELFKCNSKLLWRLGSLNGLREAVPKQCSMEEKTVLVACGGYFGKGYLEWFASVAGGAGRKEGEKGA